MAHNLMKSDWMFSAVEVPWHGIGTIIQKAATALEALGFAKLDWSTESEAIYRYKPINKDDLASMSDKAKELIKQIAHAQQQLKGEGLSFNFGQLKAVNGWKATTRNDLAWDHPARLLGVVGESYQTISNAACFDLIDRVVGGMGAQYETAGSLRDGKQVFLLARCPNDLQVMDDVIRPYLLLSTAHDGSGALEVKITIIRVVCNNTLSVAVADQSTATVRVKHTSGNVDGDGRVTSGVVSDVRQGIRRNMGGAAAKAGVKGVDAFGAINSQVESFLNAQVALFNRLAETEISPQFVADYLNCLVPAPLEGSTARSDNRRKSLMSVHYGIQPGDVDPRDKGSKQMLATRIDRVTGVSTAYRLLNTLTHYNDHLVGGRQTVDKVTGTRRSEAEARFDRIFATDQVNFRDIGTKLLVEGVETNGQNFKEALAKYNEVKRAAVERKAVMVLSN